VAELVARRLVLQDAAIDEDVEQSPDLDIMFEWVSEVNVWTQVVVIPTSNLFVGQISSRFQFGHDSLGRPLCDPDLFSNVA
jgi:hypothetical protein